MKQYVTDYLKQFEDIQVSPIWDGERLFHFLCLGHLEFSKALGFEIEQVTPVLKVVREGQLETAEQLDQLIRDRQFDENCFDQEIRFLREMEKETGNYMKGGGCFGPLTVVSGILGAEAMLRLLVKDPGMVERFVAYVTDHMIELAKREGEEGAEFFWIAEPLASLLSPKNFWHFSGQYLKQIYEAARAPGFLHVCGKTLHHTKYMEQTGAEVLSIDSCTDIGECIRMVDERVIIMGNVSPAILWLGSRGEVEEEVEKILEACHGFSNFVLSTGCSVMEGTPQENMQVMFDLCKGRRNR